MVTEKTDADGNPTHETGVRNRDGSNVAVNEGITEMYSKRDMQGINPEYNSIAYTSEVAIMEKYEDACGEEKLKESYFNNDIDSLRQDFDKSMGEGKFDDFCDKMDSMHETENKLSEKWYDSHDENGQWKEGITEVEKNGIKELHNEHLSQQKELEGIVDEYKSKKLNNGF